MKIENSEETLNKSWLSWEDAILGYSTASGHKSVGLRHALRDWSLRVSEFARSASSDSEDENGKDSHSN